MQFNRVRRNLPLTFSNVRSPCHLTSNNVNSLPTTFQHIFHPRVEGRHTKRKSSQDSKIRSFIYRSVRRLVPQFVFLTVRFTIRHLPSILNRRRICTIRNNVRTALFPTSSIFKRVRRQFIILSNVRRGLCPPIQDIRVVSGRASRPHYSGRNRRARCSYPPHGSTNRTRTHRRCSNGRLRGGTCM